MKPKSVKRRSQSETSGTLLAGVWLLFLGLALVQVLLTFRGLRSEAGMDHAQLARQVARGEGWVTQCVRPQALNQVVKQGSGLTEKGIRDTALPPLPTVVLAGLFSGLKPYFDFAPETGAAVYVMDRVVAGVGLMCWLATLFFIHGVARRLLDEKVALAVLLALGLSQSFWDLAVSGSPRVFLMMEVSLAARLMTALLIRREEERSVWGCVVGLGLVAMAMAMTMWLGVILALVMMVAMLWVVPHGAKLLPMVAAPMGVFLVGWAWRSHEITGDLLGAGKPAAQAFLNAGRQGNIERGWADGLSTPSLTLVVRAFTYYGTQQFQQIYGWLGAVLAAPLFFLALMHRFRRPAVKGMLRMTLLLVVAVALICATLGGLRSGEEEHQLWVVVAPLMVVFGTAFLALLWSRLSFSNARSWWASWGYVWVAVGVSALPLITGLPQSVRSGLLARGDLAQWPPFWASRVGSLNRVLNEREVMMADAPAFAAWYTDRVALWLPMKRTDWPPMREVVKAADLKMAGVLVTPVSARVDYVGDVFTGSYAEWPDVVLRGPLIAFDREMKTWPDFPYTVPIPLAAATTGEGEGMALLMVFYTDRFREIRPPAPKKEAEPVDEGDGVTEG